MKRIDNKACFAARRARYCKSLGKTNRANFLLFLCFLLLAACFSPWAGDEENATVTINLGPGAAVNRARTGFSADNIPAEALSIKVNLINKANGNEIPANIVNNNGQLGATAQVPPAVYDIVVDGFVNDWPYARGVEEAFPVTAAGMQP